MISTDVYSQEQIPINNQEDIDSLRKRIEAYIMGDNPDPIIEPYDTTLAMSLYRQFYSSAENLKDIEVYNVILKNGFTSKIYVMHPAKSNGLNIPVIYHSGHGDGVFRQDGYVHNDGGPYSASLLQNLLSKGFDIIGIDMPMYVDNSFPSTVTEDGVTYDIKVHDDIFNLKAPFYYFIAPIKKAVDFLQSQKGYEKFIMIGFSGGGWATTIYSAIDTRVQQSFPVAGSIPLSEVKTWSDRGDNEQHYYGFYDQFNYTTLYFLGAVGEGRLQFQALNKYDNCCFLTDGTDLWVKDVQLKLAQKALPGSFKFFFDSYSTWHRMSSVTQDSIYSNIINNFINIKLKNDNQFWTENSSRVLCEGETLVKTVNINRSNSAIQWFRNGEVLQNQTDTSLTIDHGGAYNAIVSNISGAFFKTNNLVIEEAPKLFKPTLSLNREVLSSSFNGVSEWFFNDQLIAGASTLYLRLTQPGIYTSRSVYDHCVSEMSVPIVFGIEIQPNPATNYIRVIFSNPANKLNYKILNINGHIIMKGVVQNGEIIYLNSNVRKGVYVVDLYNRKEFVFRKKIIVN